MHKHRDVVGVQKIKHTRSAIIIPDNISTLELKSVNASIGTTGRIRLITHLRVQESFKRLMNRLGRNDKVRRARSTTLTTFAVIPNRAKLRQKIHRRRTNRSLNLIAPSGVTRSDRPIRNRTGAGLNHSLKTRQLLGASTRTIGIRARSDDISQRRCRLSDLFLL